MTSDKRENIRISPPLVIPLFTALLVFLAFATQHYSPNIICPIKTQWGFDCPGCGDTRAAQSLITGDLTSGVIFAVGYCLLYLTFRVFTGKSILLPFSIYTGIAGLLVNFVFTIVRNY